MTNNKLFESPVEDNKTLIFETIVGSHAYNLNVETSDVDMSGIFMIDIDEHISLLPTTHIITDNKQDSKYYELRKFIQLAMENNPNILELLYMPDNCIKYRTKTMDLLINHRDLFISKKAFHTFSGYAYAQIKKATGQHKMINNPRTVAPKKEDFCWIIGENNDYPSRPIKLLDTSINDLSHYHVAALEHTDNVYRLYYYGPNANGVFRGDDMLVCDSIPKEDEKSKFCGLLIYSKHGFEKALREFKQYQEWIEKRNVNRWALQESGKLNYDVKNMMHVFRLLFSGESILKNGYPIIRFEGDQREYLMNIRRGNFKYDELIVLAENKIKELEVLYNSPETTLQHSPNIKKINKLYLDLAHGRT